VSHKQQKTANYDGFFFLFTLMGVNEIAARVGFVTARNFSSQFKKMFGLTPSEYREGRN
jgi:AraC-like DNA-binding protein